MICLSAALPAYNTTLCSRIAHKYGQHDTGKQLLFSIKQFNEKRAQARACRQRLNPVFK
jgi:hypothetical protein